MFTIGAYSLSIFRFLGGVATIEEQILGPSVFVAAPQYPAQLEDDEKTFDATQLVIHEPATDDVRAKPSTNLKPYGKCRPITMYGTGTIRGWRLWD